MATDGDACRRLVVNSLKSQNFVLEELKDLELFNQEFLFGSIGVNFDVKHLVKRLRGILISVARETTLIKRPFNKQHLRELFPQSRYPTIESLLNVHDKQNVKSAVTLLQMLLQIEDNEESPTMSDIIKELKVFGNLAALLLSVFVDTKINLLDQLVNLSQLGFILLCIYRKHGSSFISKNLYLDMQSTVQDAYISAAWFKEMTKLCQFPNFPLYLFQLVKIFLKNKLRKINSY